GATCATGQATELSLYDDARARGPLWLGKPTTWKEIDHATIAALEAATAAKRQIVLLSATLPSPSTRALIDRFGRKYPTFRHVVYDATSMSAVRAANALNFGRSVVPHYLFGEAQVIVGLDADFLGTWLSPVEFSRAYASGRKALGRRSLHVQVEPGLSVTGS